MEETYIEQKEHRRGIIRHSTAHVLAAAVQTLFADVKFGIGPAIEDGFYYDFELPRPLTVDDLPVIEAKMRAIIDENTPFIRKEIDKGLAREFFSGQPYKMELIDEITDERVITYKQGSFTDLCRGPHLSVTGEIPTFKLTRVAGAYWRGDEKRAMLQRIYGVAFETSEELEGYLKRLEEAAKRDHRKLGRELSLFSIHDEAGAGLVHWHPKGAATRGVIEGFWKAEHQKRGYEIVYTPHISKVDLWKTSGHWDFYRDNLYSPMDIDGQDYIIKPMNCVGHILIYKTQLRSYRDLPLRMAELGTVYRYERSGVLHGLARVRGFTQDDAHIFCRADQIEQEVFNTLELAQFMMSTFGFNEYELILSTRPDHYAGTDEIWTIATDSLKKVLDSSGLSYRVDPGEGAFYGPKIDVKLKDALGRLWQGPTIQVDFNLPLRFQVNYTDNEGHQKQVVMIHRTVLGSMERFFACLTENYGGAFPCWLSPIQVVLIPIADRHLEYARKLESDLRQELIRVRTDDRNDRMNLKIRDAQMEKVPFMLILGDKETESGEVSVRLRNGEDQGKMPYEQFKRALFSQIKEKF